MDHDSKIVEAQISSFTSRSNCITVRLLPISRTANYTCRKGYGVEDVAVDVATLHAIARAIPHSSVVLVGPVTLPPESLRGPNIHMVGPRPYAALPAYVQSHAVTIAELGEPFAQPVVEVLVTRGKKAGSDAQAVAAEHSWDQRASAFFRLWTRCVPPSMEYAAR
jgi:hypothetical protein